MGPGREGVPSSAWTALSCKELKAKTDRSSWAIGKKRVEREAVTPPTPASVPTAVAIPIRS